MSDETQRLDSNIWPLLTSHDPHGLRRFLAELGFLPGIVVAGERDGEIIHSEMLWPDGGRLMVCNAAENDPHLVAAGSASIYVVCRDPDAVHVRAVAAGAKVTRELTHTDYGARTFSILDPTGNQISFGSYAG